MRITKLALLALPATILLALSVSASNAQPDVRISELDCNSDPELVVIENVGDQPQQLAGWQLLSDPTSEEVFDLVVLGGLEPLASVFIQAGPGASGIFKWGDNLIFRDDDPTDFVRLVDETGATVDEVACASAATPEPTPTAEPTTEPVDVPNGGGAPADAGGLASPGVLLAVGGWLSVTGAALLSLPFLRRWRAAASATEAPVQRAGRSASVRRVRPAVVLALLGVLALFLVLAFRRRGG